MSNSLFDALAAGTPAKNKEVENDMSNDFAGKIEGYKNIIIDAYMKNSIDVNKSIAKIAQKENFNDDQISRLIEEVNNQIYLLKYNQMKGSPEREVKFDIASLQKINEIIKNGESNKPINQQKEASTMMSSFEKTASENSDEDSLNFLNFSGPDLGNLNADTMPDRKKYLTKIASEKINKIQSDIDSEIQKYAENIYTIADVLIAYDRSNVDVKPIFEKMCKEASLYKINQIDIKEAILQKVAQSKEYKIFPDEYVFDVDLVDIEKVADEFSLGKYSFTEKLATDKGSNQNVPVVVSDKKTVRSVNNLIDMAANAMNQKKKILDSQKNLGTIKNKLDKK